MRVVMTKLEQLIRCETANSALAFRPSAYAAADREELLVDVLALANAQVPGPRLLVLGVVDELGSKRRVRGVEPERLARSIATYQRIIAEYIEPSLDISMRSLSIQNRTVAAIVLRDCDSQPYVIRKDFSKRVRRGDGWIRRGSQQARLGRADLEAMFNSSTLAGSIGCELQVVFAGAALSPRLTLAALPLHRKPSELAGDRIRGLLEAKQAAHERLGQTDTWLDRLAYARVHGADQPYETQTPESLLVQLARTKQDNEAADRYYEYELRAHKVNVVVINVGDGALNAASIVFDIPQMADVDVARGLYAAPGICPETVPQGYPKVEAGPTGLRIAAKLGRIQPRSQVTVFQQPLRLLLRQAAVGRNLALHYTVSGDELQEPRRGALHIQITEDTQRFNAVG